MDMEISECARLLGWASAGFISGSWWRINAPHKHRTAFTGLYWICKSITKTLKSNQEKTEMINLMTKRITKEVYQDCKKTSVVYSSSSTSSYFKLMFYSAPLTFNSSSYSQFIDHHSSVKVTLSNLGQSRWNPRIASCPFISLNMPELICVVSFS